MVGLCVVSLAGRARATQPSDLICQPNASPPPGDSAVPENPLLFGFGATALSDPSGQPVALLSAPPPWDGDGRYHVPAQPLLPATTYTMLYELDVTSVPGSFTTSESLDTQAPSAPQILWIANASDPNQFSTCATDHTELFGLTLSTDDQSPQSDLRYSLSSVQPDGGLALLYNELEPLPLPDGGPVLAVQYGLQGLPGDYVVQARDLAGNLSAPSAVQHVEIGPGCTFASSTTGRRDGSLWAVLFTLALSGLRRGAPRNRLRRSEQI